MWAVRRPSTASRRRAYHAACGMAASGAASLGLAGVRVRIFSKVCTMCTRPRLPAPPAIFTQRQSCRKAGADHQARWARPGEGGRGPSSRSWRGSWTWDGDGGRGGVRESGSGGGGGWGWRMRTGGAGNWKLAGAQWGEGDVAMARWWHAWRRPGERKRRWRALGIKDAYGRRGDLGARCCSQGMGMWTWDGGGVRCGARGSSSGGSGALGGRGGALGSESGATERLSRGGSVGIVSAGGGCAVLGGSRSAAVCGTRPRRGARLAREEASRGPRGPGVVQPGTVGGGGKSATLH